MKKIENFGEENIHEREITESTNQDNLSNKDWDAKIMRIGMGKWLTSIEKIGTSIIGAVKGSAQKEGEEVKEEGEVDEKPEEEKSEHQTESTAGMSNADLDDL